MTDARTQQRCEMLRGRLKKNLRRLRPWAAREGNAAFRIFDRDIPEIPLTLDLYADHLVVADHPPRSGMIGPERASEIDALVETSASVAGIEAAKVHKKVRTGSQGGTGYDKLGTAGARIVVEERPCRFLVNLDDYLDTGLFLDHRTTRRMAAHAARGGRMLNLFGYTGAFAVHAAAVGASHTLSVDLSPTYTRWAQDNLRNNGASAEHHRAVCEDVFAFLGAPAAAAPEHDVIVLDPPTVSLSKRATRDLDIQRDAGWLIERSLLRLRPAGVLFFSTNFRTFVFPSSVRAQAAEITDQTVPLDFPRAPPPHRCWRIENPR